MKKLLHERLRYIANENEEEFYSDDVIDALCKEFGVCEDKSSYVVDLCNCLQAIAAEVETDYQPKPRDTEGNSVHEGIEVEGGVVSHWSVSEDGSWSVSDSYYEEIQCGNKDEPIRLPEP